MSSRSSSVNPPRIHLRLPAEAAAEDEIEPNQAELSMRPGKRRKYDTRGIPDEYEVQVPKDRAKNTFVFQEKVRDWGIGQDGRKRKKERGEWYMISPTLAVHLYAYEADTSRAAEPKLLAAVAHEGAIKPTNNEKYRKILDQRRLESEQTRRSVSLLVLRSSAHLVSPIIQLESTGIGKSEMNRLASGYSNINSRFGKGFIVSTHLCSHEA